MKIFYDTSLNSKNMGGVLKAAIGLFEGLLSYDKNIEIVGIQRKDTKYKFPSNVHNVTFKFPYESTLWRSLIYPVISYLRPNDVFLFEANGSIPRFMNPKMKKVMILHDVLPLVIPGILKTEEHRNKYIKHIQTSLDRADIVFTVSNYSKEEIEKNFKLNKGVKLLGNASIVNKDDFNPDYIEEKKDYFVFSAGWQPRKNLDKVLRYFTELHKTNQMNSKLLICGTPEYHIDGLKELVDEAVSLGVCELLGYVKDDELSDLLKKAKGLLYPSKLEGFGLPPVEAMAMGCPVITEYATSIPEVCEDAVLYADIEDKEQYCQALLKLDRDSILRKQLAFKGFERVKAYSWREIAEKFIDVISEEKQHV